MIIIISITNYIEIKINNKKLIHCQICRGFCDFTKKTKFNKHNLWIHFIFRFIFIELKKCSILFIIVLYEPNRTRFSHVRLLWTVFPKFSLKDVMIHKLWKNVVENIFFVFQTSRKLNVCTSIKSKFENKIPQKCKKFAFRNKKKETVLTLVNWLLFFYSKNFNFCFFFEIKICI